MLFKPDLDTAKTAGKNVARSAGRRMVSIAITFVILGGLVTSTILNLFLLPPLYLRFRRAGR